MRRGIDMIWSILTARFGKLALCSVLATGAVVTTAVVVPVAIVADDIVSGQSEIDSFLSDFPGTLEKIGNTYAVKEHAFEGGVNDYWKLRIPRKVTRIGAYAFKDAFFDSDFSIPSSVHEIDPTAFEGSGSFANYWWEDPKIGPGSKFVEITQSKDYMDFAAKYPGTLDNKRVVNRAFYNFRAPEGFSLPPFVTEIGYSAFENSVLPTSFKLPDSVIGLWDRSFAHASLARGFYISRKVKNIGWGYEKPFIGAIFAEGFTLPDTVKRVHEYAFSNASLPLSFSIPSSTEILEVVDDYGPPHEPTKPPAQDWHELGATIIPEGAMWSDPRGAVSGSTVVMRNPQKQLQDFETAYPNKISRSNNRVSLVDDAFANRDDLPYAFVLPSTISAIGASAFKNATLRQGFTIPEGAVSIDPSAFEGVKFDRGFFWSKSKPVAGSRIDRIKNNQEYIVTVEKYPESIGRTYLGGGLTTFRGAKKPLEEGFVLPSFIDTIGFKAFAVNRLPKDFRLHENVVHLESLAFTEAIFPPGFSLPPSIKTIGKYMGYKENSIFWGAYFADGFTLPNTVEQINEDAFYAAHVPMGFAIPASTRIYKYDSSRKDGFYTSPDFELLSVNIPENSKWDSPSGKAVAGAKVVPA